MDQGLISMEIGHPSVVRAPLSKFDAIYMFARFHLLRLHKTELALHPDKVLPVHRVRVISIRCNVRVAT